MENINIRFVFDKKGDTKKDPKKEGLIQIEVRDNRTYKTFHISTGVRVVRNFYKVDKGETKIIKHIQSGLLTTKINKAFNDVYNFAHSNVCNSIEDIKKWSKGGVVNGSFIKFMKDELLIKGKVYGLSLNTIKQHNVIIRKVERYNKLGFFSDLTSNNIDGFEVFIRGEGVSVVTANKNIKILRGYVNNALKKGFISNNPFDSYAPKKGKSKDPVYLTEQEVQLLKNYAPDFGYLERTRDLFLFQCYTGLAYIDLMNFNTESVSETDGFKVIRSNRIKTDENFITLFLPEAERIAIKYKYDLPKLTNQKYNEYLKDVAKGSGINKQLVSHSARHKKTYYHLLINGLQAIYTRAGNDLETSLVLRFA